MDTIREVFLPAQCRDELEVRVGFRYLPKRIVVWEIVAPTNSEE